ncbi:MAG: NDP-sugar synthase [Candidatus Riflebacteria bacterium]|nr:NDP-sugar synthase [Candidatus Riflebacteria bacterium]
MRAYIIATGYFDELLPIAEHSPQPLISLIDKPVIQHIIEGLVELNVKEFDFLLYHFPEKIEAFLGDGKRWGCTFRYHLVKNPESAFHKLLNIWNSTDELTLVGNTSEIPDFRILFDILISNPIKAIEPKTTIFFRNHQDNLLNSVKQWTNWGIFDRELVNKFLFPANSSIDDSTVASAEKRLLELYQEGYLSGIDIDSIPLCSLKDFASESKSVLAKHHSFISLSRPENDPGIWISRNVTIHPAANLVPPLFIGENSQIASRTTIGPNVVVGANCFLDENSNISNSLVFTGTYIGEGLELKNSIVYHRTLINLEIGTTLTVTDDFLLAPLIENPFKKWVYHLFGRISAILIFLLISPIFIVIYIYCAISQKRNPISCKPFAKIPAEYSPESWKNGKLYYFKSPDNIRNETDFFIYSLLPGILSVIKGEICLVGLPPRTREEILQMPFDWRCSYLRSKAGLITEEIVTHGFGANEDEKCASEMYYIAVENNLHDLSLINKFCLRLIKSFFFEI